MHIHRLLRLADILDSVPKDRFDIKRWRSSCGTVECAIGHAANDDYFKELGLTLDSPPEYPTGAYSEGFTPRFKEKRGINAVADLFGITPSDAEYLFVGESYDTPEVDPSDVAQRIRLYVYD